MTEEIQRQSMPLLQEVFKKVFKYLRPRASDWFSIGREMNIALKDRQSLQNDSTLSDDDKLEIVTNQWLTALSSEFTWDGFVDILTSLSYQDMIKKVRESEYFNESGSSTTDEPMEGGASNVGCVGASMEGIEKPSNNTTMVLKITPAESNMVGMSTRKRKSQSSNKNENGDSKRSRLEVNAEDSMRVSENKSLLLVDSNLDTSNHREVYIACTPVSAQWKDLGTRLGLSENTLAIIQADNRHSTMNCLSAMITAWLRRPEQDMSDDVLPSWRNLCQALSHIDKPLAERISEEHGCGYINPIVSEISSRSGVPPAFLTQSCGCGQCTVRGWRTGRLCQNMYSDRQPKLLLVNPGNPKVGEVIEFERDYTRQARLARETSYLVECFRSVCLETWEHLQQCLQKGKCQIADVALKVAVWLNKPLPVTMISQLHELQIWFHSLRVSWFNFRPLQFISEVFLCEFPDLMATWSNYHSAFKDYCSTRNLKSYVNVFFQVEDQNVFLLEVDEQYHDFTLSDIEALRDSLSLALDVPSVCLHLVTVMGGSLIIYFHYCYSDYLMIFKSLTTQQLMSISQIKAYKILSLTDLHNQFTYDNIQQKYNDEFYHDCADEKAILNMDLDETACVSTKRTCSQQIQQLESQLEQQKEHIDMLKKQSLGTEDKELSQYKAEFTEQREAKLTKHFPNKDQADCFQSGSDKPFKMEGIMESIVTTNTEGASTDALHSNPTVTTNSSNVIRCHYSDLSMAIAGGSSPDLLLSVSNRFYQHFIIDWQTKANVNRSGGLTGASMLLDHVMMKIDQSDHFLPLLVMNILWEDVALTDIVRNMEATMSPIVINGYDASIVPVWCHQELSSLHYGILPVYRTIKDFNKHKQNNAELYTDPFYTSDGGYRATLSVNPNGYGSGEGTHVSVFINLMKGPNDDNLEFPITGIFTTEILNWKRCKYHERGIVIDNNTPVEYKERVTTGERARGWGQYRFLPHDDLMSYLHHNMMCFKIASYYPLKQTKGCSPVPSWCDVMYSTSATPPCTRTLYSYSVYKKTNSEWNGQPFYSSDKGYKLQLSVYANGDGSGEGTHLSLYVNLMEGEYDDTLSWPFNATITVQLLNWPSDNHHEEMTIPHHEAPIKYRVRIVEGTEAPGEIGYDQFISHTSLESPSDPTVRFINDDNICFRIINIDIIN